MAGDVDQYVWSVSNLTALCTTACLQESSNWVMNVEDVCDGQTHTNSGKLVPVDTIPAQFHEGLSLACLKPGNLPMSISVADNSTTPGSNSATSDDCASELTELPESEGMQMFRAGSALRYLNEDNETEEADPEISKWCFLVSQNLQGVDSESDCDNEPDSIFCTDPDTMDRMANLYPDNVLCDPCVLSIMWFRLSSEFLPDDDRSDWLMAQYLDITHLCNITMPEPIIRALPEYALAPSPSLPVISNSTGNSTSNATCEDQLIMLDGSGCDEQAKKYSISTGDLQFASRSRNCSSTNAICAPESCDLQQVGFNSSCSGLAAAYSSASLNITISLFMSWNRHILGLCNNLTVGQYVCSSPPGGFYQLPPPLPGSSFNGSGPVRGGQGSDSTSSGNASATASIPMALNSTAAGQTTVLFPNSTSSFPPTSTLPFPTQSGITPDCNKYMDAKKGDYCSKFATDNGISEEQLYDWNPILGKDGADCDTKFQASTEYCVGISLVSSGTSFDATSAAATSNAATDVATSSVATPSSTSSTLPPMQSGISSKCNKFDVAKKGDYCSKFATDHSISAGDLYTWNSILGENGKDCDTLSQAGVLYCVGVSS
ncbi:unnamed protein product [Zymoseptoria tritici ST99CH_3D7]|uniref:LysM domain-containing protein n=1 Tax=Zymoseptoria tritici (strain ST99CH_3D7) TaxID=1276538 RepID=A0A1X7S0W7_ZYMT9|nr:unnamed protein product [Zymoseptoria tritici ST99CH_3D7]